MSKWDRVPFSDLLIDSRDGEWGEGHEVIGHQLCEVVRGTDFENLNEQNIELPKRWVPDHLVERKKLLSGDIIFEMAGGTAKQSTGRSALLKQAFFDTHSQHPILCASFCRHLRLNRKRFHSAFVYYLLQTLYAVGYMAVFNIQHTGVSRFQYTSFKKHTVLDIPRLLVQRNIAATLSAYDELIENNQRRIALLEKMAEEIYREWFVRMRFPGHEKVRFIKGVPEGWDYVGVTVIANVRYGKNLPTDKLMSGGLYPVYGAAKIIGMYEQASITERTIITGCRGSVGQMAITKPKCFVTNNSFTIKPNRLEDFFWLYHNLCLRGFDDVIGGAAQPQITLEGIASAKIILPISELRDSFYKIAMPMYEQIWALQESIERIVLIRDALLPRLISGKLSVEHLDIQFPTGMEDRP